MPDFSQSPDRIKAESYLTSFLPSIAETSLDFQGVFSRNYLNDIISIEEETFDEKDTLTVKLSRDSLFHILPEGLFFRENDLRKIQKEKNKDKFKALSEKIIKEKQKILAFFNVFDKTYFRLRFEMEQKLNELAENRTQVVMEQLFDDFDVDRQNRYINRMMPLIPLASEIRNNKMVWKDLLHSMFFPAEVTVRIIRKRTLAGYKQSVVKTNIYVEKLSNQQFRQTQKDVQTFARFFHEWFIPADMGYEFKVKDAKERFVLGREMTLDYNTYL